jgi:hypothetical protein
MTRSNAEAPWRGSRVVPSVADSSYFCYEHIHNHLRVGFHRDKVPARDRERAIGREKGKKVGCLMLNSRRKKWGGRRAIEICLTIEGSRDGINIRTDLCIGYRFVMFHEPFQGRADSAAA